MRSSLTVALLFAESALAGSKCCTNTISRDVAVIGGGASGSHAAVWLRDHEKSVVVIEKADQLGGHTNWYQDPETGKVINIGVQAWMQYKDTYDFPTRMGVSTNGSMQFAQVENKYINFASGKPVKDWVFPAAEEMYPALQRYLDVLLKYEDMMLPGFFDFPDKKSIPEDLTMPFRDLVKKYDFAAAVPQLWDATAQGLGDTMDVPSLFFMQASPVPMVQALLGTAAAAVPESGRLYDLYESVADFLGDDVMYSSSVVSAKRSEKGVKLVIKGAEGEFTCVDAKRLLVAAQPTPETIEPLKLDKKEKTVLDKFAFTTVFAGVLQHPSLVVPTSYSNRSPLPGSTEYLVYPTDPQVGRIDWLGDTVDLFQFTAVGTEDYDSEDMQSLIGESIDNMIDAGTINATDGTLSFSKFANHGKMHPKVTEKDLKAGFITDLMDLQGRKATWWTGAAWSAGLSNVIWEYNNVLLPQVIEGI
ncbi:NAD(P)-binding rossmann-like domain-containing protein [Sarocladium implicatum]|nr:NAD(P)-binding rossmann-like domain-containing protein [Sarocladium implicatum]